MHKNKLVRPRSSLLATDTKHGGACRGGLAPRTLRSSTRLPRAEPRTNNTRLSQGRGTRLICTLTGMYLHMQMRHNLIRKWGKYENEEHFIRRRSHRRWFLFQWCFQTSTGLALSNTLCKALTGTHQRSSPGCLWCHFPQKPIMHASELYRSHSEAAERIADSTLQLSGIPHFSWKHSMMNSPPKTHLKREKKTKPKTKPKLSTLPTQGDSVHFPDKDPITLSLEQIFKSNASSPPSCSQSRGYYSPAPDLSSSPNVLFLSWFPSLVNRE